MTHSNILATVSAVMTIIPRLGHKDVYLAYLPLAHVLELAAEVHVLSRGLWFTILEQFNCFYFILLLLKT